jgi:aminoglycoside 3-N-acetyltransferase
LRALGVRPGDVLLVHSSARSLGFVAGGVQAVVQVLLDTLGPDGTLMVPTHTSANSDPARWVNPPVPASWWPAIREQSPGFDPARTPSQWMGIIAETTRTWPGALRSNHPQVSFAAWAGGPPRSPARTSSTTRWASTRRWARSTGSAGRCCCSAAGTTRARPCTWPSGGRSRPADSRGASVRQPDGSGQWVTWTDVLDNTDDFEELGADLEAAEGPRAGLSVGRVGKATARLTPQRALVDFAGTCLATHRTPA